MDRFSKGFVLAAGMAALTAIPAQAQTGWGSIGLYSGYVRGGELAADNPTGADFSVGDDILGGASLEFWMGSGRRVGLRLDGSITKSEFDPVVSGVTDDNNDVIMMMGDANLMFRLRSVEPDRSFLPYLTAGAGGIRWEVQDELVGQYPEHDVNVRDDQGEFAWTFGIGSDFFLNDNVSLRLEIKDYWYADGPYHHVTVDDDYPGAHNVQFRGGLNFFWGGRDAVQEPGFIQEEPEPAPAPAPRPEPQPEPEPVTEMVNMCVVGDDGDLETVRVIRYVESDRMVVDRNGTEVAFATAYPSTSPRYVRSARWYMNDEPVTLHLSNDGMDVDATTELGVDSDISHLELVRFGSPSTMSASGLMYVGSVDGTPVYVTRRDAGAMATRIESALATEDDLEVILRNDAALARDFSEMETYYMAVEPGCVFQPVSLTTYVRATRGEQ